MAEFPGGGEFSGREAAAGFVRGFVEAWESARYEYSDARMVNGYLVHDARWEVKGKTSGVATTVEFYGAVLMEGELLKEMVLFWTEEETLAYARGGA